MSPFRRILSILLVLVLLLAPVAASARAGATYSSGSRSPAYSSQGSRGSQTYSPYSGAAPIQRSTTPRPGSPGGYGAGGYGGYGQPGFMQRHPFLTGLFGGWLIGHLFGGGYGGYGYGGGGGILGPLLLIGLVFLLFRFGSSFFGSVGRGGYVPMPSGGPAYGAPPLPGLALADQDFEAFGRLLVEIQGAWGAGDLNRLRRAVTPEMLSYFADQLATNQSLGRANCVDQVTLQKGDIVEAWSEPDAEYATSRLRWSARDYTIRLDRRPGDYDYILDGSPNETVEAEEIWTFRRAHGGQWLLSAIQQAR